MTTDSAYSGGDPRLLLSDTRDLARRVRREQRATWFPLLVFAVLTFASIPVRRYTGHHLDCRVGLGLTNCRVYSDAQFVYWPIALVLAYTAIAAFYIRRTRARGVGTRVWPYAIAGIVIAAVLTGVAAWELHSSPIAQHYGLDVNNLRSALGTAGASIGLGLLVLAWVERNRALLVLTLVYLVVVVAPGTFLPHQTSLPWLTQAVQGGVLLLGGIGFALAQRPLRSPSP